MPSLPLRIAEGLALPLDAVTQTFAVLAIRRAGKSYLARRFAEELLKAKQQVVIVDPKGDWWGIRSSADGKAPGYPVVIAGGERGDVPLEVGSGPVIARLIVEEGVSVLLDLSLLRKREVAAFMGGIPKGPGGFLEQLYRLKAREENRHSMMLVIDEADAIAPQRPQAGEERMLGAAEDLVRRGGQRGIGCMMVTQRSAVINKNVLTQSQVLVALRTISPQDLKALDAWTDVHGTPEQRQTLLASLPSLPRGEAWVWSPGWPTDDGIFKRVRVPLIETYDSGATPKPGERRTPPKTVADVDLEALRRQMAETIEKAKAEDPRELQRQIRELRQQLAAKSQPPATPPPKVERVEVPMLSDTMARRLEGAVGKFETAAGAMLEVAREVSAALRNGHDREKAAQLALQPRPAARPQPAERPAAATVQPRQARAHTAPNGSLTGPEQRILDALAYLESVGIAAPSNPIVAFLAGYTSPDSAAYKNPRGHLRETGLVTYPVPGQVSLTEPGRELSKPPTEPPTATHLQERLLSRLTGPEERILRPLLAAYPKAMAATDLACAGGYSAPDSAAFKNPRGHLRALGLITYPEPGYARANSFLFLEN